MNYPASSSVRDALMIESLDEPIIATRLDGTIIAWSAGATRLYGWSRDQAIGKKVHQLLKTVSLASADEIHNSLLAPEARWSGELRKTRLDGSSITVSSHQHLLTEPGGEQIVIARDRDLATRSRTADNVRRRQDDAQFLELRERFQFATEAARIGYWFCDLPFDKLIWDARVKEHFFLAADAEVDIQLFYQCLHPDDRERTRQAIEHSIASHTAYDIEYRTLSADGRQRWIRATGRTAYDAVGIPIRFDGITQDISALKQAEAELNETRSQLTSFADSIPTLAWMANPDGYLVWYNRRWYEYTGTTPEQMEGWGWQAVHDPAALPSVIERWAHSIRTGEPFEMIFPLKGADGIFRSFLTRVTPARNQRGEIVRWFGTNTEIDELQRTRQELQRSENRVRVALQTVDIVLYTTDQDLRYTWIYHPHGAYPAETMLGRRDIDVEPEKFREAHEFKLGVLNTGIPGRREISVVIGGQLEVFDYAAEPLRDDSGAICGLTVAALNITQRRLSEETLRKTEKLALVGRLAASIAHEINNPLESVVSLLYVARTVADNEELRNYLISAEEEMYRVSHIVTQSLRFNRQSTAPGEVRLSTLIESALALYRGRLKHSPVQIITCYRDTQPLLCLPSELRQVFANLIGNSFEATRAGSIVLRARSATDWRTGQSGVRCTVADSGCGIDHATLQHLFEPFITTKGELGTGLGLWVSAEILRRHHATVKVRSSSRPGRSGTVFFLFFPHAAIAPLPQTDFEIGPFA
jgi:two-component system, sporulation sensor kinase E